MRNVVWRWPTLGMAMFLLAAGLLLRMFFVHRYAFVAGDSTLYLDISQSWIDAHTYGLSTNAAPRPTLIRLPGYPMVLAVLQLLLPRYAHRSDGSGVFACVMWLQVFTDLGTCLLVASLAGKHFGLRAGTAALALGTLCPFMANYTAVPLTETFVLFTIALAYWTADSWRRKPRFWKLLLTATALSFSVLLRPDQVLLAVAVLPLFANKSNQSSAGHRMWAPLVACTTLTLLPLGAWTVRNAVTFHVFQPLAPKSATDPGEPVARGFQRWYRTFAVDFTTTEDAYWNYPEYPVDPSDLPGRAFDTAEQRALTVRLFQETAVSHKLQPAVESAFARLAQERIRADRFRYYVELPVARLINMLLHPRTEMLPVDSRWWRFRLHPSQTLFVAAYGLLNLVYFGLAILGLPRALRTAHVLTLSMCAYLLLRCALLLMLDNAEQRYTMEFYPVLIFLCAAKFAANRSGKVSLDLQLTRDATEG